MTEQRDPELETQAEPEPPADAPGEDDPNTQEEPVTEGNKP